MYLIQINENNAQLQFNIKIIFERTPKIKKTIFNTGNPRSNLG